MKFQETAMGLSIASVESAKSRLARVILCRSRQLCRLWLLSTIVLSASMTVMDRADAAESKSIAKQIGGQIEDQNDNAANAESDQRWNAIKPSIFGERTIRTDLEIIDLEAPHRAFNGSRVPLKLRALIPQNTEYFIKKIYLVIDKNPLPLAGTFQFEANNGWATIETEVRINEYTTVRAIAETSDNNLYMSQRFVKAVGGCSALPDSYDRSDANAFGNMDLVIGPTDVISNDPLSKLQGDLKSELPGGDDTTKAKFKLIHPNASGMQYDQFSRTYIPAHYIHTIVARFNDRDIFTLDTNFSLSQDPTVSFNFVPLEDGEVTIYAIDSKNQRFEQSWPIKAISGD